MTQAPFSGEKGDGSSPPRLSIGDLHSHNSLLDHVSVKSACSTSTMQFIMPESKKAEVLARVQTYLKQSRQKKMFHNALQLTIFIGAALITVTLSIPNVPKIIPVLLASIVTVATAIANYYKFGERSRDIFLVAEELGLEHNRFDTMRGDYKNLAPEDAFVLFMDKVETIIHEDTKRCFALESSTVEPKTDSNGILKQP